MVKFAAVAGLLCLAAFPVHAQSPGSFSAAISNVSIIPTVVCNAGVFDPANASNCSNHATNVLNLNIKTSNGGTSLLVNGSLETAILTNTLNTTGSSKGSATGSVVVSVLVDGQAAPVGCTSNCPSGVAYPPVVTYDQREQTMTANLGQLCSTVDGVTSCTGNQSIDLLLSTTSAHSFQFIVPNLSVGVHTVAFNVAVSTDTSSTSLTAGSHATAAVGVGSLTAQVVKTQTPFNAITLGTGNTPTWQF